MSGVEPIYQEVDKNLYHDVTLSKNPIRKWFHLSRYRIASMLVEYYTTQESRILDLGCGSCDWNTNGVDVFGVDGNEELLKVGLESGRLNGYKVADISETGLDSDTFDLVAMFEVLEHIRDYEKAILEADRLIKPGGRCIVSVPYDVMLSLWKPLFFLQVVFHGYVLKDPYYRKGGGHINHFSKETIRDAFVKHGFTVEDMFVMRGFTIFCVFRKPKG